MLFEEIVYGPIHSRRLGISLGINLMPQHHKLCSFDCVYCECGFNSAVMRPDLPSREEVAGTLEAKLQQMQNAGVCPDVITFSGNGEPTMHPDFEAIIDDTCLLRDRYCPAAKVSVLSNSTQLFRDDVRRALLKADNRILKLDSAITDTMRIIDQPVNRALTAEQIIDYLRLFDGQFTLQTCFLTGEVKQPNPDRAEQYICGKIDNTTETELTAWYAAVDMLRPKQIMIYVIDRKTPVDSLYKISPERMHAIAEPLIRKGYDVSVSC